MFFTYCAFYNTNQIQFHILSSGVTSFIQQKWCKMDNAVLYLRSS